jgi:hypothetical protein
MIFVLQTLNIIYWWKLICVPIGHLTLTLSDNSNLDYENMFMLDVEISMKFNILYLTEIQTSSTVHELYIKFWVSYHAHWIDKVQTKFVEVILFYILDVL